MSISTAGTTPAIRGIFVNVCRKKNICKLERRFIMAFYDLTFKMTTKITDEYIVTGSTNLTMRIDKFSLFIRTLHFNMNYSPELFEITGFEAMLLNLHNIGLDL